MKLLRGLGALSLIGFVATTLSCTQRTKFTIASLQDYRTLKVEPQFKGELSLEIAAGSIQFRLGCSNDQALEVITPKKEILYGTKTKDGAFVSVDIKDPAKGKYKINVENEEQCSLTVWANPKIKKDSPWASESSDDKIPQAGVVPNVTETDLIQEKIKQAYESSLDSRLYKPGYADTFKNPPSELPQDFSQRIQGTWVEGVPLALPRAIAIDEKTPNPLSFIRKKISEFKFLPNEHNLWIFESNGKLKRNEIPGIYEMGIDRLRVKLDGASTWDSLLYYDGTLFVSSKEMGPIPLVKLDI